ncbi:MAG TPA: hypothetical protein VLG13_02325 [Patescibacteria group bacterium]|nr:hypothetical protein [Patescibacteria group bacterium]
MNLPFRNKGGSENAPVVPEMNAPLPLQPSIGSGILWWRVAILALGTVAVVILLFFAGRWAVHKASHKSSKPSVSTSSSDKPTQKAAPSKPKAPSTAQKPTTPSNATSSGLAGSSASAAAPTNNSSVTSLTNTGPGETAAVFVIIAASGVIGYQVLLRRRTD